jgi:hypothetical protein
MVTLDLLTHMCPNTKANILEVYLELSTHLSNTMR